jgi:3-dehydroquinate synthase
MSVIIAPIASSLPAFLATKAYTALAVLVDEHTKKHCWPQLRKLLPSKPLLIEIPSGEGNKHLQTAEKIWSQLTQAAFDRHALVLNLGGGVIGDMGGFCAATYKRGIDFVQIPTTLLSQVDASVGGKLGIDFQGFKNHIGVFQQPVAVLVDPDFLQTLPWRERRSGFAEIIKHCLIADASMWQRIRRLDLEAQPWPELISHSVEIKKQVVAADPTEKGLRKILNFGHTLGHAIETHFLGTDQHLLHGEAIAAGMIAEAFLSYKRGDLSESDLGEIEEFIFSIYGKIKLQSSDFDKIINLTLQDKKNQAGQVRFSLLTALGQCGYDVVVSKKEMKKALEYLL